jgi:hypothetical protein
LSQFSLTSFPFLIVIIDLMVTVMRVRGADPSKYETNLVNLIRDLRKDLKAPDMKVVVGTSGMCGFPDKSKYGQGGYQHCAGACATLADPIIPAQLAVGNTSKYPEFKVRVMPACWNHRSSGVLLPSSNLTAPHAGECGIDRNQRLSLRHAAIGRQSVLSLE